jgi:hypothetical protein
VTVDSLRKLLKFRVVLLDDCHDAFVPLPKQKKKKKDDKETEPSKKTSSSSSSSSSSLVGKKRKKNNLVKLKKSKDETSSSTKKKETVLPLHLLSPTGCIAALSLLSSNKQSSHSKRSTLLDKDGEKTLFLSLRLRVVSCLVRHVKTAKNYFLKKSKQALLNISDIEHFKFQNGIPFHTMLVLVQKAGIALMRESPQIMVIGDARQQSLSSKQNDDDNEYKPTKSEIKGEKRKISSCLSSGASCLSGYADCLSLVHFGIDYSTEYDESKNVALRPLLLGSFLAKGTVVSSVQVGIKKLQTLMWSWLHKDDLSSEGTRLLTSSLRCLNCLCYVIPVIPLKKNDSLIKTRENIAKFYKKLCSFEYNDIGERNNGEKKILSDRHLLTSWVKSFIKFQQRMRHSEALSLSNSMNQQKRQPLPDLLTPVKEVALAVAEYKRSHSLYSQTQHSQLMNQSSSSGGGLLTCIVPSNVDLLCKDVISIMNSSLNDALYLMDFLKKEMNTLTILIDTQNDKEDEEEEEDRHFMQIQNDDDDGEDGDGTNANANGSPPYWGECSPSVYKLNTARTLHEEELADVYNHLTSLSQISQTMLILLGGSNPTLSDLMMKLMIKFYRGLVSFTKCQYKFLSRCQVKMLPRTISSMVRFVTLVTSSQDSLTQMLYGKLPQMSTVENDVDEEDEKIKKRREKENTEKRERREARERMVKKRVAVRRSKTVPELIFQIEQWESELLKLTSLRFGNKKNGLKVLDLGSASKFHRISRNRDFKINDQLFDKITEENSSSDDDEEDDEEEDNSEEEDVQMGNTAADDDEDVDDDDEDEEDEEDEEDVKMGNTADDNDDDDENDDDDDADDEETQALHQQPSNSKRRKVSDDEGAADL